MGAGIRVRDGMMMIMVSAVMVGAKSDTSPSHHKRSIGRDAITERIGLRRMKQLRKRRPDDTIAGRYLDTGSNLDLLLDNWPRYQTDGSISAGGSKGTRIPGASPPHHPFFVHDNIQF